MKNLIIAVFATLLMGAAHAQLVEVDGTEYDVLWEIGTFDEVNAAGKLEAQTWWGDAGRAETFAAALGYIDVNDGLFLDARGPMFVSSIMTVALTMRVITYAAMTPRDTPCASPPRCGFTRAGILGPGEPAWAIAEEVNSEHIPVPGSLALIVLGLAGLGITRKARR